MLVPKGVPGGQRSRFRYYWPESRTTFLFSSLRFSPDGRKKQTAHRERRRFDAIEFGAAGEHWRLGENAVRLFRSFVTANAQCNHLILFRDAFTRISFRLRRFLPFWKRKSSCAFCVCGASNNDNEKSYPDSEESIYLFFSPSDRLLARIHGQLDWLAGWLAGWQADRQNRKLTERQARRIASCLSLKPRNPIRDPLDHDRA